MGCDFVEVPLVFATKRDRRRWAPLAYEFSDRYRLESYRIETPEATLYGTDLLEIHPMGRLDAVSARGGSLGILHKISSSFLELELLGGLVRVYRGGYGKDDVPLAFENAFLRSTDWYRISLVNRNA